MVDIASLFRGFRIMSGGRWCWLMKVNMWCLIWLSVSSKVQMESRSLRISGLYWFVIRSLKVWRKVSVVSTSWDWLVKVCGVLK